MYSHPLSNASHLCVHQDGLPSSNHTHLSQVSPVAILHADERHVADWMVVKPCRHVHGTHDVPMVETLDDLEFPIPAIHELWTQVHGTALL